MKSNSVILFVLVVLYLWFANLMSWHQAAPILYVGNLPGTAVAHTLPPIGIIIESAYAGTGSTAPTPELQTELDHWDNFLDIGALPVYYFYIKDFLTDNGII
jgi:hypothetical protein